MKKIVSLLLIFLMLFSVGAQAAEVVWNDYFANGEMTAKVVGIDEGDRVLVGVYDDENKLTRAYTKLAEGDKAELGVSVSENEYARAFIWDGTSLEPKDVVTTELTEDGIAGTGIFSDNVLKSKPDAVGYRSFDALYSDYKIELNVTVWEKDDNAILIGDSTNGTLGYENSSAVLLFNGESFQVKNGNGDGTYASEAVTLCQVETQKEYHIVFSGSVKENTYTITITDGENVYESEVLHARKDAAMLDTIALVTNGRNTLVANDCYSNFAFLGKNLVAEPDVLYSGFEGLYYAMTINGGYLRGNGISLVCDYTSAQDDTAKFIPRDMADGSHAFVCKSTGYRITTANAVNKNITNSTYSTNDNKQHWIMEKSENWSESSLSYYLKHIDTGYYIGMSDADKKLLLVEEDEKREIRFIPLYDDSPMYLVSKTKVYSLLTDAQRERLITVYESLAGDIYGRYGGNNEWTPRIRMDNLFNEVMSGTLTEEEQLTKFDEFLTKKNGFIYSNQANHESVSATLPGTEGTYVEITNQYEGNYLFWSWPTTRLDAYRYIAEVKDADGNLIKTMNIYVEKDNATANANYETFLKAIVQMPDEYIKRVRNVMIYYTGDNTLNAGGGYVYIRLNWRIGQELTRNKLAHELTHIVDGDYDWWSTEEEWTNAIASDMYYPSGYATTNSTEDFAEFGLMYFAAYHCKDRQRALKVIMPARYAAYGKFRQEKMNGWELWEDEFSINNTASEE